MPEPNDSELLVRYATRGDDEVFAAVVRRHAAMVQAVCRRVLADRGEAEDVAQAVFLALANRATSVAWRPQAGGWLHTVAWRLALNARPSRQRRQQREELTMRDVAPHTPAEVERRALRAELDQALGELPERYRLPLILFHLEEHSREEPAAALALNPKTTSTRLVRGRALLRERLRRRGVAVASVGAVTSALAAETGAAELPATFVTATVQAARLAVAGKLAAGVSAGTVSAHVAALTKGALEMWFWNSVKTAAAIAAASLAVAALVPLGLALAKPEDPGTVIVPTVRHATEGAAPVATTLRVPAGFQAAAGVKPEPYTKTGWAQEIVHATPGMAFVYVPAGEFLMGSPADEKDRSNDEVQHRVTLTKGFYLGKYEVTQKQWIGVMGNNPSGNKDTGETAPVEQVSWDDGQAFVQKLNVALLPPTTDNRQPTTGFRLPTEAEWEYACRAGTKTVFHDGDSLDATQANFDGRYPYGNGRQGEYRQKTVPVASFKPNAWGLYDMHGNAWEWCADCYGDNPTGAVTDPTGPAAGLNRVGRGGSWGDYAQYGRSAYRIRRGPGYRDYYLGCRLAFSPAPGP